ncbi:MAG TPA: flagellar assembly protein H, partial [Bacteroidetes bacterium]|nr:flagellar assembly protein H [Bacteroidota bacterium]
MALITHFMDTYLRLSEKEELMMMQEIKATLEPQEQERIMVYTNSWLEKGISIGKQ